MYNNIFRELLAREYMKFLLRTSNIKFWLYNWFNKRASWYRQLWIQSANFRIIQYAAHFLFSIDFIRSFYSLLTYWISNGLFFSDAIYCLNLILSWNLPIYLHIISKRKIPFKKNDLFLISFPTFNPSFFSTYQCSWNHNDILIYFPYSLIDFL